MPMIEPLATGQKTSSEQHELDLDDLKRLRRALQRSGPLDQAEVRALFAMHRTRSAADGFWIEFFIDALSEFFLSREGDRIFLEPAAEQMLIDAIGDDRPVIDPGHRRLSLRLHLRMTDPSERYQRLVLDMMRHHLLHDRTRLLVDLPRSPGTVDPVDLQLIRKLVLGAGAQDPGPISRVAAGFLLDIDEAPLTITDEATWKTFLLQVLSRHLSLEPTEERAHSLPRDDDAAAWLKGRIEAGREGRNAGTIQDLLKDGPHRL